MPPTAKTPPRLAAALDKRAAEGILRSLFSIEGKVDFSSNDYLGIATRGKLHLPDSSDVRRSGSTGSRLLSGNSPLHEAVEAKIASFHGAESALLFNSGYDANVGLLGCIASRHDTVLLDERCHASIFDGSRLSYAKRCYTFRHNDLDDLRKKLERSTGDVYVVVESVYSMDGDSAPIEELLSLARHRGFFVIVDEAHGAGVFGPRGEGLLSTVDGGSEVLARVVTYGKAFGCHGAAVCGSTDLRKYLINFARSFIFSTALSPHAVGTIEAAYDVVAHAHEERARLFEVIAWFSQECRARSTSQVIPRQGPIQWLSCPNSGKCREASRVLLEAGFDVRPILSPTVPPGAEGLRFSLHSFNTKREISTCFDTLARIGWPETGK